MGNVKMPVMGNKIVVRYQNGHIVKGHTSDFLPTKETFHYQRNFVLMTATSADRQSLLHAAQRPSAPAADD